jgi:hypothetical protein
MPEPSVRGGGGRSTGSWPWGVAGRGGHPGQRARPGATLPGLLGEGCAPGIAARRAARLDRVVLVTGTNGKTTTTAMLAAALAAGGRRVVSNAAGSNLYRAGDGAAGRRSGDPGRRPGGRRGGAGQGGPGAAACLVVLLNLTRDQLDRHHEVGGLARRWRPAVAALARERPTVASHRRPGRRHAACPACGSLLSQAGSESYGCGHAAGPWARRRSGSSEMATRPAWTASVGCGRSSCRWPAMARPWTWRRRPASGSTRPPPWPPSPGSGRSRAATHPVAGTGSWSGCCWPRTRRAGTRRWARPTTGGARPWSRSTAGSPAAATPPGCGMST